MNKKNKLMTYWAIFALSQLSLTVHQHLTCSTQTATGTLKITFINTVKHQPLVMDSVTYTNPFAEDYTVTKFRYYISHMALGQPGRTAAEKNSYHLVDADKPGSLSFNFPVAIGAYNNVSFLIGVDSLRNVSGAQTGALDPVNDMFWTWMSGYVMAKMEGRSPLSNVLNKKIEYHIGGYRGENNVIQKISLPAAGPQPILIQKGKITELVIEANLDNWWSGKHDIKIVQTPVCTSPGVLAKNISENYKGMFALKEIINPRP
jgi:hypothetical protein